MKSPAAARSAPPPSAVRRPFRLGGLLLAATLLVVGGARAQARTDFLANQLKTSDDYRLRTQAALALGTTGDPAAVPHLCGALAGDGNEAVRAAAAAALGKLGNTDALACLQGRAQAEPSANVKAQIGKSIKAITDGGGLPSNARVYVAVGPTNNKTGRANDEVDAFVRGSIVGKLRTMQGYALAPRNESPAAAQQVIAGHNLKGFFLQVTVDKPTYKGGSLTVGVHVVISTYPGKDIKGEASPKLTQQDTPSTDRASEDNLIRMAIERAVDSFQQQVVAAM